MWGWISGAKSPALNLPINVGDETAQCLAGRSVFKLFSGTHKTTSEPLSVFKFEVASTTTPEQHAAARAEFKRLRVLRHPSIVKYIDGVDAGNIVVIVTEPVVPLLQYIQDSSKLTDNSRCWGLYQTITALRFLHEDCGLPHRNLYSSSIFVANSGDWKLGGVGWCDQETPLAAPSRVNQYLAKYDPPEVLRGVTTAPLAADVWGLGVLVWEVFNGNLSSPQSLKSTSKIPNKLLPVYRELVSSNYKSRPKVGDIFLKLSDISGYFDNSFVSANIFLNELSIKEPCEKQRFFVQLTPKLEEFPVEFSKYKILPALITTFQFGDVGIDVLPPLFKLGKLLSEGEYKAQIIPCVIKLFSSPDRAMRVQLLSQLDNFIHYLDNKTIDSQIFPAVATGFTDTVPGMREQTVKSMLQIAGRLSESTIDNQLLKFLAKAQTDPEPPIRTNTTICLSKIAVHFSDVTRRKVLIPAFLRALKDPFLHARNAGLLSLGCTAQYYGEPEIASRILPAICPLLMDHERAVREQALKTVKLYIDKIERYNKGIPDKPPPPSSSSPTPRTGQESQTDSSKGWTSWAVSSVTSIAGKYTGSQPTSHIGELQRPPLQPAKPVQPTPAQLPTTPTPSSDDGWEGEAGWDDVTPPTITKTKSSMKLGGVTRTAVQNDDDFIANILKEEQGHLKESDRAGLSTKPAKLTESPRHTAPLHNKVTNKVNNDKVKLTPWDDHPFSDSTQNKDILASYFSSSSSDFFGELSGEEVKSDPVKSAWDEFNIPDEGDGGWGHSPAKPAAKPAAKPVVSDSFKPPAKTHEHFKPIRKPEPLKPGKSSWDNDDDWGSPTTKSKPTPKPVSSTAGDFKPTSSTFQSTDDWSSTSTNRHTSTSTNKPISTSTNRPTSTSTNKPISTSTNKPISSSYKPTSSTFQPVTAGKPSLDDWDSGWGEEEHTRKPAPRKGPRRGGRLGVIKKD